LKAAESRGRHLLGDRDCRQRQTRDEITNEEVAAIAGERREHGKSHGALLVSGLASHAGRAF
jgi:hypothetical protein